MTTTQNTMTSRAFGKCTRKGCKGRKVLEVQGPSMYSAFEMLRRQCCPECEWSSKWDVSWTNVTLKPETPCRQSCTDAMTPNCKCSCGGTHHGENVADYDKWSGS
jgi:hypothetical protein